MSWKAFGLLISISVACSPKVSPDTNSKSKSADASGTGSLKQSWYRCVDMSFSQSYQDGPGSSADVIEVDAKGVGKLSSRFFIDTSCNSPYTEAHAKADLAKYKKDAGDSGLGGCVECVEDALNGYTQIKVTRSYHFEESSGLVDIFYVNDKGVEEIQGYSSYRISKAGLEIARLCSSLGDDVIGYDSDYGEFDRGNCERLEGEKAANRSKSFEKVPPFVAKKS